MKRIVEVEEIVKIHHQIYVEYDRDNRLVYAIENEKIRISSLDDFINNLVNYGINVTKVNENYSEDVESIEYYDDYMED